MALRALIAGKAALAGADRRLLRGHAICPARQPLYQPNMLPLPPRIANALVSYVAYLGQFFYPVGLAVFYPYPQARPAHLEDCRLVFCCWLAFPWQSWLAAGSARICWSAGCGIWECSCP